MVARFDKILTSAVQILPLFFWNWKALWPWEVPEPKMIDFFRKLPIFLNPYVKSGLKWNSATIVNQVHLFHLKNKLSSIHHCLAFLNVNPDDLTKKSIRIHEKDFYSKKFIPDTLIENKLLQNTNIHIFEIVVY